MRKVYLRLLPFAVLTYFFCYLDRINVGFAALTMNKDLGLDPAMYGMAAGAFFWGYVLVRGAEQHHPGKGRGAAVDRAHHGHLGPHFRARRRFAPAPRASWRCASCSVSPRPGCSPASCCFSPTGSRTSTAPGSIPASPWRCRSRWRWARRCRPRCSGSTGCWGLKGWQCMYLFEAVPTVLIGVAVFFFLTDRPAQGALARRAAARLAGRQDRRRAPGRSRREHRISVWRSFWDPKVLLLALNYLGIVTASLGMLLFLPTDHQAARRQQHAGRLGDDDPLCLRRASAWCSAAGSPTVSASGAGPCSGPALLSAVGLVIAGMAIGTWWSVVGMSIAAAGFYGTKGPFWSIPSMFLTGTAAAVGHRLDQLARQSRRVFRPDLGRLGQEPDRQLRRRALCAGGLRRGLGDDLAVLAAHPAADGDRPGCRGDSRLISRVARRGWDAIRCAPPGSPGCGHPATDAARSRTAPGCARPLPRRDRDARPAPPRSGRL